MENVKMEKKKKTADKETITTFRVKVGITGLSPLLMNNPKGMFEKKTLRSAGKDYDVKADAEKSAYTQDDGTLYIPAEAITGCMRGASSWVKVPRGTPPLRQLISGVLDIQPSQIPILDKEGKRLEEYKVDVRRVVIMHSAVPKARAVIPEWQAEFTIGYNTAYCPHPPSQFKRVLDIGGHVVGILDFRPQHSGHFGTFEITEWTVEEV